MLLNGKRLKEKMLKFRSLVHDICTEPLDRGRWCEPMSNRYYFNKKSNTCKGFHYTGCGLSANNFLTLSECEQM